MIDLVDRKQFDELLNILGAPAHLEVLSERQDLLRFGESRITYQHSEERLTLRTKLIRNSRAAWGMLGSLDCNAVAALRKRLETSIEYLPIMEGNVSLPTVLEEHRTARTFFSSTAAATAEDRVAWFARAVEALPRDMTLGGSIVHTLTQHSVGNSNGLYRSENRTRALVQQLGTMNGRSSYVRRLSRDMDDLQESETLNAMLAGLAARPKRTLSNGVYRAVLAPTAVITLLAIYGHIALNGAAYANGTSAVANQMGEQIASRLVNLVDDGYDQAGLPTTFDCEGTPKQRVVLIQDGCLAGVVHNTRSAGLANTTSTGHAVPPDWRFGVGPSPSHLLLAAGNASEEDLIAECDNGLYIQRVDYVRVIHPKQTLVTGTSRDATKWIENGQVVGDVPQFRFTLKLTDVFSSILELGKARERGETVFMESVCAPAVLVGAFPVDAVTQ